MGGVRWVVREQGLVVRGCWGRKSWIYEVGRSLEVIWVRLVDDRYAGRAMIMILMKG